jgi:hypothetical protein
MLIVWLLTWWYGPGWKQQLLRVKELLARNYDYFSINLLLATLFNPFRQISAGRVNGPIGLQLRAFADRLISRCIGAVVRSIFIVVGSVWLGVMTLIGGVFIVLWALVPVLPFVGFIVMLSGWVPVWN